MPRPFEEWKVLPHGKLTEIADNILSVTGNIHMPLTDLPRTMTVVRLRDGRLIIWSAIALDESEMKMLEQYGLPTFLVVPNDHHRLDAKIWKERYPELQVITPAGARAKVEEVVHVDATALALADVDLVPIAGSHESEAALVVRAPEGTTLLLGDLIANVHDEHGFGGWVLRRMGFAGERPQVPWPAKSKIIDDVAAVRQQLIDWAGLPALRRILVTHGAPIEERPGATLLDVAATLN